MTAPTNGVAYLRRSWLGRNSTPLGAKLDRWIEAGFSRLLTVMAVRCLLARRTIGRG
jgi:hypothetical protein